MSVLRTNPFARKILATLSLVALAAVASAQSFRMVDLGLPRGVATGVSDNQTVVGYFSEATATDLTGFRWINGISLPLSSQGPGYSAVPMAVNASNQVVGNTYFSSGDSSPKAALWDTDQQFPVFLDDLLSPLDAAQWTLTTPYAISDGGVIVGQASSLTGAGQQGFAFDLKTHVLTILAPSTESHEATAAVEIGGDLEVAVEDHFLRSSHTASLYTLSGLSSLAPLVDVKGISSVGWTAGRTYIKGGACVAAIRDLSGATTTIGALSGTSTSTPHGIAGPFGGVTAVVGDDSSGAAFYWQTGKKVAKLSAYVTNLPRGFSLVTATMSRNGIIVGKGNDGKTNRAYLLLKN